ncbi:MAG: histidine kinase dimerization/phospho-acceptor domain-containing protein [Candidatus Binataceae bacterium]
MTASPDKPESQPAPPTASWLRRAMEGFGGDDEPLGTLKLAAAIGVFFLLLYFFVDLVRGRSQALGIGFHLLVLAGAGSFLALTWTPGFHRFWKLWTYAICAFIMATFIPISAVTGDPESRLLAVLLCPLATASFVSWGPRWQFALSCTSLIAYGIAETFVPISTQFDVYRWMGLFAGLALGECTAFFIERYRKRIRAQLQALEEAARFREREIATMAHDIRNPLSALAGYADLLEQTTLNSADRDQMVARIGSTAWTTNLVVSNLLDLYRMEERGQFQPSRADTDPNPIIAEAAEDCAVQARRAGIGWRCDLGQLPHVRVDPHHLDRIVRNLAAVPIACANGGEVLLRASVCGDGIAIEVNAPAGKISSAELDKMIARPRHEGVSSGAGGIGLYLVRSMIQAAGGNFAARAAQPAGIFLRAEIPFAKTHSDLR